MLIRKRPFKPAFDSEFFPDPPQISLYSCDKYESALLLADSNLRFPCVRARQRSHLEDLYEDKGDMRSESGSEKSGRNWSALTRGDEDER